MDFFLAQVSPTPVPDISNGWQFAYLIVPIILTFITSMTSLIFGYLNHNSIKENATSLGENTHTTNQIHQLLSGGK